MLTDIELKDIYKRIAKNIKTVRTNNYIKQKQMAEVLGIDPQYYARLERSDEPKRHFTLDRILIFCDTFKIDVSDLFYSNLKKINTKIITKDGDTGIIIGFEADAFNKIPHIKLDKWTKQDIERMGGESNAWVMLPESYYEIVEEK